MPAPPAIQELVQRFEAQRQSYRSTAYKEANLRLEFIDPFFEALGWDVANRKGYAEAYKDVVVEDAVRIGGAVKAPDYAFRIGGTRKFFIEAKAPSTNIKDEISPAYQLRRYAWSSKLPLSILTDFEEFAVYDCRSKPDKADKASTGRILYLNYRDYLERWDEIAAIFSREAVLKGSFDRYAESTRGKRGTTEVDDAFLAEIERWRELLARNIALRNDLNQRQLNYAVQMTLDRLIFLRICEDRGIEFYGQLQALLNGNDVYPRLVELFHKADQRFNSGLFHFQVERERSDAPDNLTPTLQIDDRALKDILKNLYYPDSPYEFSVLPADILGQVYEQFLGKVIRLTSGGRAVVEAKPEVKKAGGVYYTPTYIVAYIVRQAVGALLEGRQPGEPGLGGRGAPLRVLDPACGSGSFLIGAYQYLLDWYRDGYLAQGAEKHARGKSPRLYQAPSGEYRLTSAERKRILTEHIYGVDIDPQAVEVTKLSLLLKVLEGESDESLGKQLSLFRERALPDLGQNIKCGNSLIGPDFYHGQQLGFLDEEEHYRINAFDWEAEFPEALAGGGFDAVIGNPPYVRQEGLGEFKYYLQQSYHVYHSKADLYAYFIEKGITLLRDGGYFCYIVANKWMRANYGEPLRRWLKTQAIAEITDFGDLPVFEKVTTYPCILRVTKNGKVNHSTLINIVQVTTLDFSDLSEYVNEHAYIIDRMKLDDQGWSLADAKSQSLKTKLKNSATPLGKIVKNRIYNGIKTGLNQAFIIDETTRKRLIEEDSNSARLIVPFLMGRDVRRYTSPDAAKYLIIIPKGWTRQNSSNAKDPWRWLLKNYPAIANHLALHAEAAQKRYDKGEYWWELRACEYYEAFEEPKIFYPNVAQRGQFVIDFDGKFIDKTCYFIGVADHYLLGLLNSKLIHYYFSHIAVQRRGGYFEFLTEYVKQLPIHPIDFDDSAEVALHDRLVALVERMLALHRQLAAARTPHEQAALQRQVEATDREIDALVYQLYGLTEAEIAVVEQG